MQSFFFVVVSFNGAPKFSEMFSLMTIYVKINWPITAVLVLLRANETKYSVPWCSQIFFPHDLIFGDFIHNIHILSICK